MGAALVVAAELRYQNFMFELDLGDLGFIEGVAAARRQDVLAMVRRAGEFPEVCAALERYSSTPDPDPIPFGKVSPIVAALPTIYELAESRSGIHARLTTTLGMELLAFTCDPVGSAWSVRGVLLFPREPLDLELQEQFVVDDIGGEAAFLTLDEFEAALFGPAREGRAAVFRIFAAELEHAPGGAVA